MLTILAYHYGMFALNFDLRSPRIFGALMASPALCIGLLFGIIMPMISGLVYPTYMHMMPNPVTEWTRLQELPFVVSEVFVIGWAMIRGMELRTYWSRIPRECLIAIGIFMVGLWGSTLFVSKVPATSLMISLSYVLHLLFAVSIFHLIEGSSKKVVDQLAVGLGYGLAALAAFTAWRFLLPPAAHLVPGGEIEWVASLPGFINVRHFGSWTGAIAAIFTAMILQRRDDKAFNWQDIFFLLSMAMTIWSGTRAAILAIAIAVAILVVSTRRLPSFRVVGRLSMLTGIAACIAFLLIPYGDSSFYLFSMGDSFGTTDQISSGRVEMWVITYNKWLDSPWFGWGSGSTFWEAQFVGWSHTQPHNFVLQFLISWGIVGATGAFWLLARAVIAAQRIALAQPQTLPLLAGLYALLLMACLEGMLHYPRFIMLIMLCLAVILSENGPNEVQQKVDKPMSR